MYLVVKLVKDDWKSFWIVEIMSKNLIKYKWNIGCLNNKLQKLKSLDILYNKYKIQSFYEEV